MAFLRRNSFCCCCTRSHLPRKHLGKQACHIRRTIGTSPVPTIKIYSHRSLDKLLTHPIDTKFRRLRCLFTCFSASGSSNPYEQDLSAQFAHY